MDSSNAAELALKYDYAETKDLLKTFITLISGTLILSIAFADKIIDVKTASQRTKKKLMRAWTSFVLSLIGCGISMCFIAAYAGCRIYSNIPVISCGGHLALISWGTIVVSGGFYVAGFCLLIISARHKLMTERPGGGP